MASRESSAASDASLSVARWLRENQEKERTGGGAPERVIGAREDGKVTCARRVIVVVMSHDWLCRQRSSLIPFRPIQKDARLCGICLLFSSAMGNTIGSSFFNHLFNDARSLRHAVACRCEPAWHGVHQDDENRWGRFEPRPIVTTKVTIPIHAIAEDHRPSSREDHDCVTLGGEPARSEQRTKLLACDRLGRNAKRAR
jgi:hypothetical protein